MSKTVTIRRTHLAKMAAPSVTLPNAEFPAKDGAAHNSRVVKEQGNIVTIGALTKAQLKARATVQKQESIDTGKMLADVAIGMAYDHAKSWKEHFADVLMLDAEGLKAYRLGLEQSKIDRTASGEFSASAEAQLSECKAVAKAREMGLTTEDLAKVYRETNPNDVKAQKVKSWDDLPAAAIVKASRAAKDVVAAKEAAAEGVAPPAKQGRPALTAVAKFVNYMNREIPVDQWEACRAELTKMIAAQKKNATKAA